MECVDCRGKDALLIRKSTFHFHSLASFPPSHPHAWCRVMLIELSSCDQCSVPSLTSVHLSPPSMCHAAAAGLDYPNMTQAADFLKSIHGQWPRLLPGGWCSNRHYTSHNLWSSAHALWLRSMPFESMGPQWAPRLPSSLH